MLDVVVKSNFIELVVDKCTVRRLTENSYLHDCYHLKESNRNVLMDATFELEFSKIYAINFYGTKILQVFPSVFFRDFLKGSCRALNFFYNAHVSLSFIP